MTWTLTLPSLMIRTRMTLQVLPWEVSIAYRSGALPLTDALAAHGWQLNAGLLPTHALTSAHVACCPARVSAGAWLPATSST